MDKNLAHETLKSFVENTDNVIVKDAILVLHTGLAESEDERIRKRLIECLKLSLKGAVEQDAAGCSREKDIEAYKWGIAYLEKQKDQPADAKSERVIKAARRVLNNWLDGTDCPDVSGDFAELEYAIREYDGEEKQKEHKPAEWSEEDKELLDALMDMVANSLYEPLCPRANMLVWLKSLRPYWKPSKEQMNALSWAINYLTDIEQGCASTLALLRFNLKEML